MRQTALTQDFSVMDLFAGVQKLNEDYDVLPFGRETIGSPYSPTPPPQHQFFFFSPLQERNGCLCLFLHSSLWEAWWFGGWRVSQQCIAPFHPGAVQSSCPIKQAASPGPLPQASSQGLFLHHLFSVTHLQLNCGGCCIPPITTSYTSP